MIHTELIHEHECDKQRTELLEIYRRAAEIFECAEWSIGRDFRRYHQIDNSINLYVWKSDDNWDINSLPVIEIAYYYDTEDGCVHFLGARNVTAE